MAASTRPLLSDLCTLLAPIAHKYYAIGTALGVLMNTLGFVYSPHTHQDNLRRILEWWLNNGDKPTINSPVTWDNIISVVGGPVVQNYEVARRMRQFVDMRILQESRPQFRELYTLLDNIAHQYAKIGGFLGVPGSIDGVDPRLSNYQNLVTILRWWLDNGDNPTNGARSVTWGNIIDVIENGLPNYRVAKEIKEFLQRKGKMNEMDQEPLQFENDPNDRPNMSDAIECIQGITQETNSMKDSEDTRFQLHGTDFEEIDQYYLHMALKEGEVIKSRITKTIVQGPARAGKTSLKCMLLHQKYQTELSTSCIEKPHIAVGKFALDESGQYWTGIDEEEMTDKVIAELRAFTQKLIVTGAEVVQNVHTSTKIPLDTANVFPKPAHSATNIWTASNIDFIDDSSQNTKELTKDEKEAIAIVRELFDIASKGIKANQLSVHQEWLYFIDSGGQIQFQKLLQAFLPCASVLILVFSLADNFSSPSSTVMQCEDGKISMSDDSITVEELLKQLVTMVNSTAQELKKIIQNDSTLKVVITPPDDLSIIAVGTHRDVYGDKKSRGEEVEDIDVKEMKLGKILRSLEMKVAGRPIRDEDDTIIFGDDTIIHEVDGRKAKREDFNDEVVQAIGKRLQDQAFEVQVPLKWYCLDILLHKVAKKSHGVLSVTMCQRLGVELGISSGQEVISALKFFHILNTVLYYPESTLSDLVFVLPQMSLVQIISELMAKICKVRISSKILDKAAKMLPMEGKISVKRLKKESETCKNLSAIFPNFENKFLSLFKDLLIAAKIPRDDGVTDNDQYFIPALLPVVDPSNHPPFSVPTTPLLYYFDKGLPMGFFCAMIVRLLTSSSFCIVTRQDSFNYSNYVILSSPSVVGKFVFIEKLDWFEIHSESSDNQSTVMTAVDEAVKATVKVRKLPRKTVPVKAFFCPCGDIKQLPHLALFESEYFTLRCIENQETVADGIGKPRLSWFSKDTYCRPCLSDLCMVLKPVSPRYQNIGILLGVPMDTLGLNPLLNHDDNLSTTLQWWLDNGDNPNNNARSVTWNNIIDVIENGLPNYKVAEEMREFLCKGAKSKKLMPDTSASSKDDEQAEATEVVTNEAHSVTWNNIVDVIENGLPNYRVAKEIKEFLQKKGVSSNGNEQAEASQAGRKRKRCHE